MRILEFKEQPYFPSSLWVSPTGQRLTEVAGSLERPDGPASQIRDIKRWALEANPKTRLLDFDGDVARARKVNHEVALKLLFEEVILHSELVNTSRPLWLLLPALENETTRREYRRLLKREGFWTDLS